MKNYNGNSHDDGVVDMEVDVGQEEEEEPVGALVACARNNNSNHHDDGGVADMEVDLEKEEEPVASTLIAKNKDVDYNNNNTPYECSICLDMAIDPIVTCCGHLFCWPCFSQVKKTRPLLRSSRKCPVCKGDVVDSAITPIYVNSNNNPHPKENKWWTTPPRPKAQRVEISIKTPRIVSVSDLPLGERLYLEELFSQFDTPSWFLSP